MLEAVATKLISLISAAILSHAAMAEPPSPAGSPPWFNASRANNLCVSALVEVPRSRAEAVQEATVDAMDAQIQRLIVDIIESEFDEVTHPPSIRLLELAGDDVNLEVFVRRNIRFIDYAYNEQLSTAYMRGCISNSRIISYEEARITTIRRSLDRR